MAMNNDTDYAELDTKCARHAPHEVEGKHGEMKTIVSTEVVHMLLRTPENEKSNADYMSRVKYCKACKDSGTNRIADETNAVNYFAHH